MGPVQLDPVRTGPVQMLEDPGWFRSSFNVNARPARVLTRDLERRRRARAKGRGGDVRVRVC